MAQKFSHSHLPFLTLPHLLTLKHPLFTFSTNYPAWVPWREGEEDMRWRFQLNALT